MTTIAKINIGENEVLRVDKHKASGTIFIDCRIWRKGVPTGQGFSLDPDLIPEFVEALNRALDFRGPI